MGFGDVFAAQKAFNESCSGGMSLGQYCSAAQDVCCGLCQSYPVTGFCTFIGVVLGTLLNLVFTLFLATDAVVFSLVDRLAEPNNRLTLFHYAFVPLTALSFLLILAACAMAKLKYLHALSGAAQRELQYAYEQEKLEEAEKEKRAKLLKQRTSTAHPKSRSRRRPSPNLSHDPVPPLPPHLRRTSSTQAVYRMASEPKRSFWSRSRPDVEKTSLGSDRSRSNYAESLLARYPKSWLSRLVLWLTALHLVVYFIVFVCVYILSYDVSQQNCVEQYSLQTWRLAMGFTALVFWLVAVGFWLALRSALSSTQRERTGRYSGLQLIVHAFLRVSSFHPLDGKHPKLETRFRAVFHDNKKATKWRWAIALAAYALWAVPYSIIYFLQALQTFLLQVPYGQVGAAVAVISPICVIARTVVDTRDGWEEKLRVRTEARRARQLNHALEEAMAGPIQHGHGSEAVTIRPPREERARRTTRRGPQVNSTPVLPSASSSSPFLPSASVRRPPIDLHPSPSRRSSKDSLARLYEPAAAFLDEEDARSMRRKGSERSGRS
ncbi:hypothetical protein JCM8097_003634 [Rhodosporidiobolus ruineniae]